MTIKIVIFVILCLHYGSGEPPVNGYLPSSRSSTSSFHKNYVPSAANVSFNFGFAPRNAKGNLFRDSTMLVDNSYISAKSQEPFYRNADFLRNLGSNGNYNDIKSTKNVVSNIDVARDLQNSNNFMTLPTYTPDQVHQRSHATYGPPLEDNSLPIVEDSFLRKSVQEEIPQQSHSSDIHQTKSLERTSFTYGAPSQRAQIDDSSDIHQTKSLERNSFTYGPPSQRAQIDGNSEKFPYDFSYDVMDHESGVALGHRENHDGSSAEGIYHSLLPDGRLLTVEYWADDGGYKPKISYKTIPTSKSANSGPY